MSRHRAVRNLDLDDELYDDFGESTYDELQDISEEDEARLLEGVEAVKGVIGRSTGISDQEIKETLYYYYFDIDASVAWLQKEHKLNKKGKKEKAKRQPFAFDTPSPDDKVFAAQSKATNAPVAAGTEKKDAPEVPAKQLQELRVAEVTPKKKKIDVVAEYTKGDHRRGTLNLVVVGHVDAGKSTLMGHLLYALGQVNERTIQKFERDAERIGKGSFAYAWVLDETSEERERGVTMDIATSAFSTPHRKFTLLDAPGHRDFVPNMISGASRADVAVLVVDASTGGFESGFDGQGQTREHAILIRSLGVKQLVVGVNKLDMALWNEARFDDIRQRLGDFLQSCGFASEDVRYVPVSGLKGINLVSRVSPGDIPELGWYASGPCLVDLLDTFVMPERAVEKPLRLAVTDFFKGGAFGSSNGVSVSGRIAQGNVQVGETVVVVPGGERGTVKSIDVDFEPEQWAVAGDSVVLQLHGIDLQQIKVGSVVCLESKPIQAVARLEAQIVVFDTPVPITNGFPVLLHTQSLNVPACVAKIIETVNQSTGEISRKRPRHIRKGATARVEITMEAPVCIETFSESKDLGRIMLRRSGETVAAGIVTGIFGN